MDYNIYIHTDEISRGRTPTQAWGGNETNPTHSWIPTEQKEVFATTQQTALNPTELLSMGIGNFAKAIPQIVGAYAILTITKKVVDGIKRAPQELIIPAYEISTGNYGISHTIENLNAIKSWINDPFGSAYHAALTLQRTHIQNTRRELQRELLGDSVANSYSGRGI